MLVYQCATCGRVFNAFAGTVLEHTHLSPAQIVLLLRTSGHLRLRVLRRAFAATLLDLVVPATREGTTVYTDEWGGYRRLPAEGRWHRTVNHESGEWARDDDGDGDREGHCNTLEGLWTGLRNFLRTFRGVSKWYLAQ